MMARPVDDLIVEMVLVRLGDVVGTVRADTDRTDDSDVIGLQEQLDELASMVGRGELSMREYKAAREPLQARLTAAETRLTRASTSATLARLAGEGATLRARWHELDVEHRHRLISLVVDRIVIGPSTQARLDLSRIEPVWKATT